MDLATARQWYQKSAAQLHPGAMFELGRMEIKGEGGIVDEVSGMHFIGESAKLGYEKARAAFSKICQYSVAAQVL